MIRGKIKAFLWLYFHKKFLSSAERAFDFGIDTDSFYDTT